MVLWRRHYLSGLPSDLAGGGNGDCRMPDRLEGTREPTGTGNYRLLSYAGDGLP